MLVVLGTATAGCTGYPEMSAGDLALCEKYLDSRSRNPDAGNPTVSAETLRKFAASPIGMVRERAAGDPNTPADLLRELAEDSDLFVRAAVAGNPSAPADALRKLAASSAVLIFERVAGNPNTPKEVLRKFGGGGDWILEIIAANPNTPTDLLLELGNDPSWIIRCRAHRNPSRRVRDEVAGNSRNEHAPHLYGVGYFFTPSRTAISAKTRTTSPRIPRGEPPYKPYTARRCRCTEPLRKT